MSIDAINRLVEASNQLTETISNHINAIDAKVAAAENRMDAAIANLAASHAHPIISYYDRALHSKTSLEITPDPEDDTRSEWVPVPTTEAGYVVSPSAGKLTKVHTVTAYSYRPGHYETPQHSSDTSRTVMQFVLANTEANSSQINERLEETGAPLSDCGAWWSMATVRDATVVRIPDLHYYSRLWVRFINRGALISEGHKPQNILTYGGNSTFRIDRVVNYPAILDPRPKNTA